LGDTPTDNWFACVSGTDPIPDLIIGRLCVKTSADVNNIVAKIQAYEASSPGAWSNRVILASDTDSAFETTSNNLAALLPDDTTAQKVYLSTYGNVTQATTDLVNKINAGSLITNYTGHGSVDNWSGEFLFHTPDDKDSEPRNDLDRLTNGDRLTFVMALNCLNGFFPNFLDQYSLAEEFVRAQNKGAIACLASTSLGYTAEHEVLATKIFNCIYKEGDTGIGSVFYTGKINAYNQILSTDIIDTFTLFGDPATVLKLSSSTNTTTTIPGGTTTTTIPGSGCPAKTVKGEGSPDIKTLHVFRNEMLLKTETGKQYIALYYKHALELSYIFTRDQELKEKANRLIEKLMPAVGGLLAKRNAEIDEETVQKAIELIDALTTKARPSLERDLMSLKKDIQSGVIFKSFKIRINNN
jgi:hypothetical protein